MYDAPTLGNGQIQEMGHWENHGFGGEVELCGLDH